MDLRALTKLILKLVGLYYLVMVITALPNVLVSIPDARVSSLAYLAIGVWGVVGLALLLLPGRIIDRIIRIEGLQPGTPAGTSAILDVGIRLLGCYFALAALYALVYHWSISHVFNGTVSPDLRPDEKAAALASAVQLVAGLVLWIFGGALARWFGRGGEAVRAGGDPPR